MVAVPKFGGVRTGGRSARVVDQVLSATIEVLGEVGYAALRFEEVAARSGVNKTTLYRRWPTKSQLVIAALREHKPPEPAPDTGDLEADLTAMFEHSLCQLGPQTRSLARMLQAERNHPEVDAIFTELKERITAVRRIRMDAAVKRGELPRGTDVVLLLSIIASTLYARIHAGAEVPTRDEIAQVVRIVIAGARAVPPPRARRARR